MKKTLSVKIDEKHPIWQEENKTRVILDALELYYATKAVVSGSIKLNTIPVNLPSSSENQKENNLAKNKKVVKSFLNAFS
ncbi:conserved hypothetical protein [Caldicellulosiruptor hydrothermalis 108]|uniref:Uncharacterized protein n=1 Tax=Caldicellulosiruptor hydrothermalis (strain DSM 18901 / VKM B-2411 / 108) TaxID=632292 RepID=E4QBG4_CALH1|nr:hypothetical protein [Caldicellulosiruptor hydrothermalis]ADQ06066.1 conserved hypothetical protein [Caldicellulosiruptor hydrothermalis 108]